MAEYSEPLKIKPEELKKLGNRITELVRLGETQKGSLPDRWRKNEENYENKHDLGEDETGMTPIHVPFSQPKQDMLTAMVCGVIGRQDPYMIAKDLRDGSRAKRLEKAVHFFWQRARFESKARHASSVCANTNKAIWKLSWRSEEDAGEAMKKTGVTIEVIHPKNWVKSPATPDPICEARLVGNRVYRRKRWIWDRQDSGEFYETRVDGGASIETTDVTGSIERSKSSPSLSGSDEADKLVELWCLNVKIDLKSEETDQEAKNPEKWYSVWLSPEDEAILYMAELPYSRPQFFESYFIPDGEVYWTGRSVGFNLQGPQAAFDTFFTGFYNGAMAEAMPDIYGDIPEKFTKSSWGNVNHTEDMVTPPFVVPSKMSAASAFMAGMQVIERVGEQAARVSANASGAETISKTTATEVSAIQSGVQAGQEEYIANFSDPFPDMAEMTVEMLSKHWEEWHPLLGLRPVMATQPVLDPLLGLPQFDEFGMPVMADQPVINPMTGKPQMEGMVDLAVDDVLVPVIWEPTGKTPGNTPQAKLQAVTMLHEIGTMNPATGYKPYEGFKVMVDAAGLNADAVQMTEDEMMQMQMQMQMQALMGGMNGEAGGQNAPDPMVQGG